MFFRSKQNSSDRDAANRIYTRIVDASRQPAFFTGYGIPDSLDGRFEMLSLHMFLGLRRFVSGSEADKALAQSVMELFVRDMDAALRDLGVSDIKVPKRMKTLYGSFGGRIASYTLAVEAGGDALHAALARNIFPEGGDDRNVLALADYIAKALTVLDGTAIDDLRAGGVEFADPEQFRPGDSDNG